MQKDTFLIGHKVNARDLISAMAGMLGLYKKYGKKIDVYQQLNVKGDYYAGATHPIQDSDGNLVCMNEKIYGMMQPLLLTQNYINDVKIWEGEKVDVDLDVIRNGLFVNMPHGMIQSWIMLAFPDMAFDLSQQWIFVDADRTYKDYVILNFTERYRNNHIGYFFLNKYKDRLIFAGTQKEYLLFCNQWKLDIPKLEINDFYQYARYIKGCKFYMGNQSMGWNLANALMHPRLLEMCHYAPNCQPFVGEKNFGYYHQTAVEYYFKELIQ